MKFSFVIPTYNNKYLLKNTLEALNYQKGYSSNDYEVVLVDDGSSDDTFDYIKGINKNYELIYLYLERNKNSCRAKTRNHGWKNANGEIIIFIDSDIIVKSTYLSEIERCFLLNKDIVLIGNRLFLDSQVEFDDLSKDENLNKYYFNGSNFNILEFRYFLFEIYSYNVNLMTNNWMLIFSCNMSVKKTNLEKINGFDENYKQWGIEDLDIGYSLFNNKVNIVINSKLEVLHQNHGDRDDLVLSKEKQEGYQKNIDYFLTKHPNVVKINPKGVYKYFSSYMPFKNIYNTQDCNIINLDFNDINKLKEIKENILQYSSNSNNALTINDYVECSDLDVWIQLLGKTEGSIKYYPASKRIDAKAMMNFFREEQLKQKRNNQSE